MAVSWLVPPSSRGPEAQSWWGSGGAPRDGIGQSHAGWVPPTRVPSSPRPRPWATLAPARHSTALPLPVQMPRHSTRAACHSQTCRPASQVGWAAQPCFWPLCPGGPGAVGSRSPPKTKPCSWVKQPHTDTRQAHTPASPQRLSQRPDRGTTPRPHPRHATRSRDLPSSPEHVRCMRTPIPVCMRLCAHACVRACIFFIAALTGA